MPPWIMNPIIRLLPEFECRIENARRDKRASLREMRGDGFRLVPEATMRAAGDLNDCTYMGGRGGESEMEEETCVA